MDKEKIKKEFPETVKIAGCEEIFWENTKIKENRKNSNENIVDIDDAEARLIRFAPSSGGCSRRWRTV